MIKEETRLDGGEHHLVHNTKNIYWWKIELLRSKEDFIMSDSMSEGRPPHYETLIGSTPRQQTAVPVSNIPHTSFMQNVNPPPPMYSLNTSNQQWNVPAVAPQWRLATIIPPNVDQSSPFFKTFLKGKPKALGILVICAAILEIALGIGLVFTLFSITLPSGISFWGPVFYIIAGSLTVAAQTKPKICLIKGSLGLNIISSIFSMVAVILNAVDLAIAQCRYYYYNDYYTAYYQKLCQQQLVGSYTVLSLLLVINILLFSVTISTSIYGCKSLSKVENVTQVFVIQNDVIIGTNPGAVPITTAYSQPSPPPYLVNVVKTEPTH